MPIPLTSAQIRADIERKIEAGEYPPGSQLPSYNDFAAHYGVAFTTIARVIAGMRADGVVVGVPGRGVFVAEN